MPCRGAILVPSMCVAPLHQPTTACLWMRLRLSPIAVNGCRRSGFVWELIFVPVIADGEIGEPKMMFPSGSGATGNLSFNHGRCRMMPVQMAANDVQVPRV